MLQIVDGEFARDLIYECIYERLCSELLVEFRDVEGLPYALVISLSELCEFMYWLFKYCVWMCEPVRVVFDMWKALVQLSAMEDVVRCLGWCVWWVRVEAEEVVVE